MAPATATKPGGLIRKVVASDVFRYGGTELKNGRWVYQTAVQGDEIDVTAEELERATRLAREHGRPFLVDPGQTIPGAPGSAPTPYQATDEQLDAMSFEDLVGYLGQNNAEVARIGDRESTREHPRQEVLDLIARLQAGGSNLPG